MGVLAGFLEAEKRESHPAKNANPAKVSNFSNFSSHARAKTQTETTQERQTHACEVCSASAVFGLGCFPVRGVEGRWYCGKCFPAVKGRA